MKAAVLTDRLASAYGRLPIGNPMQDATLVGPLIHRAAYEGMERAIEQATNEGGKLVAGGGRELEEAAPNAFYARPSIVRIDKQTDVVEQETFALRGGDCAEQRRAAGSLLKRVHLGPGRGGEVRLSRRVGLRNRQRQHRYVRGRDRWCFRRGEGDRWRPRVRV